MATRSYIGIRNSDDSVEYIYCHFDGYPSHNGAILTQHYTSLDKVKELIALGDLSILGAEIGEKHDFNDKNTSLFKNWCLAYGRDRGENNISARSDKFKQVVTDDNVDYVYVFDGDYWECYDTHTPESNINLYNMDQTSVS
jgi:hypothetical protein